MGKLLQPCVIESHLQVYEETQERVAHAKVDEANHTLKTKLATPQPLAVVG